MTVKRLHKTDKCCVLLAENPAYPPIPFQEGDDIRIWGVVTSVIKTL